MKAFFQMDDDSAVWTDEEEEELDDVAEDLVAGTRRLPTRCC